jgi:membrane protein
LLHLLNVFETPSTDLKDLPIHPTPSKAIREPFNKILSMGILLLGSRIAKDMPFVIPASKLTHRSVVKERAYERARSRWSSVCRVNAWFRVWGTLMTTKEITGLIKETFGDWSEDKAVRLAAALSYYTVVALAPLLVIIIAIAGLVFGREAAEGQIVAQIGSLVGQQSAEAIQGIIANASQPKSGIIASLLGIATLLFGASGVFGQLQDGLNTVWEVQPKPGRGLLGIIKDRFLSLTMVFGVGFLLLVSLVLSAALSALGGYVNRLLPLPEVLLQGLNFITSLLVITLLFAMIFKVLPDAEIAWGDVWIGAAITAMLFAVGKLLLGLYIGRSSVGSAYGAAGSLIVILVWIYYSTQILFLGAEFTQVYANRYGSLIKPDEDAVAVTEEARGEQGMPHKKPVQEKAKKKRAS